MNASCSWVNLGQFSWCDVNRPLVVPRVWNAVPVSITVSSVSDSGHIATLTQRTYCSIQITKLVIKHLHSKAIVDQSSFKSGKFSYFPSTLHFCAQHSLACDRNANRPRIKIEPKSNRPRSSSRLCLNCGVRLGVLYYANLPHPLFLSHYTSRCAGVVDPPGNRRTPHATSGELTKSVKLAALGKQT